MNFNNTNDNNSQEYCFLFYKNEIICKEHNGSTKFPLNYEVEKLGIDNSEIIYIGTEDGNDYYASNVSSKDMLKGFISKDLGDIYEEFAENIFLLVLRAQHLIYQFNTHKYCGVCGHKLQIDPKETFIKCSNCGFITFPRITPAIVVAVVKDDKILLARSPHFPPNLFSLLSGHVEPGEFIETCVEREVREEVGIEIKNIKYFGSHPWPFPNKLMMGFIAEYSSGEIKIDANEIEAADWFSFDNLPHIPDYKLSFARKIIDYLLESRKNNN